MLFVAHASLEGLAWTLDDTILGGGFKYFFLFHPSLGKIPILTHFSKLG